MRVEELASTHSVSVDTVRYYQKIGLLHPPKRQGRWAQYDEQHGRRLSEIRRLADAGFSLTQIRQLCDGDNDPILVALGSRHGDTLNFAELVRQSGLDEELVRLAADTGLVRPIRTTAADNSLLSGPANPEAAGSTGDDTVFGTGALTMLRAAAELLSADMPLDGLMGLALRHASNMEAVAADAVGLFADRFADVPKSQRADLAARLIPLVTELVAQHFHESLVEHATDRILAADEDDETSASNEHLLRDAGDAQRESAADERSNHTTPLLRYGIPTERREAHKITLECRELRETPDPLAVYAAARESQRVYWASPDDELEFCALGSAFEASAEAGTHRWKCVEESLSRLDVTVTGDNGHPPLLVGGFAFGADAPEAGSPWEAFGAGRLTLPKLLVVRRGERSWLLLTSDALEWPVTAAALSASESAPELAPTALADPGRGGLASNGDVDPNAAALALLRGCYRTDSGYEALVQRALNSIGDSGLDKVVTARELCLAAALEPIAVLNRLRQRYPSCVTYAFGHGSQTFLGATPERLVQFDGTRLRTDALAGSRPRSGDPIRDRELAAELQRDPKELTEHAMVVTDVRDTLRSRGVTLDPPSPTGVMELPHIMHLHTPISGRTTANSSVLELTGALHPTAAVAGLPRRAAQRWIDEHEDFDRGWYAAPIGWTTPDGHGEFRVALRCALTGPSETRLYAGGGIVAEAKPKTELAETATKLEALMYALEGD